MDKSSIIKYLRRNGECQKVIGWASESSESQETYNGYEGGIVTRVERQIYDCIKPSLGLLGTQPRQFSILGEKGRL